MKRIKKHRPLSDEEMAQLKIQPQWWIDKMNNANKSARDTQLSGHAKLLYDSLYDQFSNLFIEYDDGRDEEVERTRKNIIETIAESDYDLAVYAVKNAYDINTYGDCEPLEDEEAQRRVGCLPDMSKWPDEASP